MKEYKTIKNDNFNNFEEELLRHLNEGWEMPTSQPLMKDYWKYISLIERKIKKEIKKVQI